MDAQETPIFCAGSVKKPPSVSTLGSEKAGEAAVHDRLSPRLQRLAALKRLAGLKRRAALIVAMALCGAAAAPLDAKEGQADKLPVQNSMPPKVRYIHCAMELGEEPCGLDPAMRRLNPEPPDNPHFAPPFDQPDFAPGR